MEDDQLNVRESLIGRESLRLENGLLNKTKSIAYEPESTKASRFSAFMRAVYSEFFGTFIFFLPILGALANSVRSDWTNSFTVMALAFITGFQAIAAILCFSSLSGAQFNPAITFALWLVGKVSNRKMVSYFIAQILGTVLVMGCIYGAFPHVDDTIIKGCAVQAPDDASDGNIFFTEFLMSFLLTFVCFAMAFEEAELSQPSTMSLKAIEDLDTVIMYSSTPQSKSGFAPFAIGFCLVTIVFFGGGSGVGLNPARIIGPAIFANVWDRIYLYVLGEFLGAGAAALVVTYGPQSSKRHVPLMHNLNIVPPEVTKTLKYIGTSIKDVATGHSFRNSNSTNGNGNNNS
jgi:glycerol uptake facilitator-like aquaporin